MHLALAALAIGACAECSTDLSPNDCGKGFCCWISNWRGYRVCVLWNSFALLRFGGAVVPLLQVVKASMRRAAHDESATMNERETAALQVEDLTYNADGLIPCIVQDEQTREVLMMAWMNEEAVRRTISQGTTWFWSRSRQKFWHKGEESGNTQKLVELRYDCDADTLLAVVNPAGPACHTGETTCFYRSF